MVPNVPPRFRRVIDREEIIMGDQVWQVISGYGHVPEHVSLWSAKDNLLISGDMVLPRIFTNFSVFDTEPDADPLGLYLSSLERFIDLPKKIWCHPRIASHSRGFIGESTS